MNSNSLRTCSHEPGTVNYPEVMFAFPRIHMMICCPGTTLPQVKFIVIWSLQIYLNFFSCYTKCYREWNLNTFTNFWCFLELFIEKFIRNNKEHAQDCSCPGATFAFCSHGEKLPRQGGLPGFEQRVTHLSMLPQGNQKLMWTVTDVRPCTEVKLTLGSGSWPLAIRCPGIMWTSPKNLQQSLTPNSKLTFSLSTDNLSDFRAELFLFTFFSGTPFHFVSFRFVSFRLA